MSLAFFAGGMPGGGEILIILLIVLLLFGGKKLPELSRSLGKSLGEFRRGKEEGDKALDEVKKERQSDKLEEIKEEAKDAPEIDIPETQSGTEKSE